MTHDEVAERISSIINDYEFPLVVLQDVKNRLNDSQCVHYHAQQLRYLDNLVGAGLVKKRGGC